MILSMTGFAAARGSHDGWSWAMDLRGVNGRGLDLRLRLPDWVEGLEPRLRELLRGGIARGSVTLSLRLQRDAADLSGLLDRASMDATLEAIATIEAAAIEDHDLRLAGSSAAEILPLCRASGGAELDEARMEALSGAILASARDLLAAFNAARAAEGQRLHAVLEGQVTEIAALTEAAAALLPARAEALREGLQAALARVLDNAEGVAPERIEQELALISVKSDVTEEIDRLRAHVAAARDLLAQDGPVGRKLDFLTQEFNREANTLCSKAQYQPLTRIGLDLKTVIDQLREQVQNVE